MADIVALLPDPVPREAAIEETSAARWDLPVDLIRAVTRPEDCPEELLGYLAWARSVDVWDEDWPAELKRHVIARAYPDQKLKGTLDLHERYLGYVGARVLRAVTPPSRFVLGARRSPTDEAALLATLPELRIYRQADPQPFRGAAWGRFSRGWGFLSGGGAGERHAQRAVLAVGETVTRLAVADDVTLSGDDASIGKFERLYIPHAWRWARVLGAGQGRRQRWWGGDTATSWVVSFTMLDGAGRHTAQRGLYPAAAEPEVVMERHPARRDGVWSGCRRTTRRWWRPSTAAAYVYDGLRLWSDMAASDERGKRSYWSYSWRGMPTHSAVLAIDCGRRQSRRRWWGRGYGGPMRPHDGTALSAALAAIRAASLPHETIFVDLDSNFERRFYGA
ncbi:phage tail protein I [Xanthobacter sediminis]